MKRNFQFSASAGTNFAPLFMLSGVEHKLFFYNFETKSMRSNSTKHRTGASPLSFSVICSGNASERFSILNAHLRQRRTLSGKGVHMYKVVGVRLAECISFSLNIP